MPKIRIRRRRFWRIDLTKAFGSRGFSGWEVIMRIGNAALGVIGLLLVCASARADIVEWRVEDGGNGHAYEAVLMPGPISWNAARAAAHAGKGFLASLSSAAENAFVFGLISDPKYWGVTFSDPIRYFGPWLGGRQPTGTLDPSANWSWDTGEPFGYTNWLPGLPDHFNGTQENYMHYFGRQTTGGRTPTWNDETDIASGGTVQAYVVEYVPEPGSIGVLFFGGFLCWARCARTRSHHSR
jgi:hypothetical protein